MHGASLRGYEVLSYRRECKARARRQGTRPARDSWHLSLAAHAAVVSRDRGSDRKRGRRLNVRDHRRGRIAIDLIQADARPLEFTWVVSASMANPTIGGTVAVPNAVRN